jgi:hypothetical protein
MSEPLRARSMLGMGWSFFVQVVNEAMFPAVTLPVPSLVVTGTKVRWNGGSVRTSSAWGVPEAGQALLPSSLSRMALAGSASTSSLMPGWMRLAGTSWFHELARLPSLTDWGTAAPGATKV